VDRARNRPASSLLAEEETPLLAPPHPGGAIRTFESLSVPTLSRRFSRTRRETGVSMLRNDMPS
jgi:hypothetical protein